MRRFDDPTGDPNAGFGSTVALLGHRLIVSAPGQGTVYALDGRTGEMLWASHAPNASPGDGFGISLSPRGSRLFVGAPGDDEDGTDTGAVYVLDGATGAVRDRYANPSGVGGEGFGRAVAPAGSAVLVGVPWREAGEEQAGGAYLLGARSKSLLATFVPLPHDADANAGLSVALTADRVVVGGYDWSGVGTVSVYAR